MTMKMIQRLRPDGTLAGKGFKDPLSDDDHRAMFRTMLGVRLFEERCMLLQRQGRIGFYIGSYGQEASHVCSGYALRESEWVFPAYRQVGIAMLRGIKVAQLLHQVYGSAADNCQGAQMPCHYSFRKANFFSISSPIASQVPQAVGAAMAAKYKGEDSAVLTYLGDGGTSEGEFHVAMNFAGVYKAPVVMIVENNQWAISCNASDQTASENFAIKATAYGFEGVLVDGNDPIAIHEVTQKALEKARTGGGPTLIESLTYRLFSHSSSDDADRYRPKDEYEEALLNEPFIRYRKYLGATGVWTQAWEDELAEKYNKEIDAAIKEVEATGRPEPHTIFENVFATPMPILEGQAASLANELRDRQSWEEEGEFPL